MELFDGTGQPLRQQPLERAGETDPLGWDIVNHPGGLYLRRRVSGTKESKTIKVLH